MIHFHSVFWRSPSSYPLFNYFPVLLESFLIASTILVCILDALTQILLEGEITRTILSRNGSLMPRWEEDCSIVITRLGTASLEVTSVAGLGNEVASVTVFDTLAQWLGNDTNDPNAVGLDRAGISSGDLVHGRQKGFLNEVKNVKAISMHDPNRFEARSLFSKELERYVKGWLRVMKGTWILLRYGRRSQPLTPSSAPEGEEIADETTSAEVDEGDYRRFLLGEAISDDEEEYDHVPHTLESSSSHSSSDNEEDDHPAELYHDLIIDESSTSPVPILLAHMVDTSSFPLTRRRYQRLITNASQYETPTVKPQVDSGASNLRQRRHLTELSEEEGWDEGRMNCVICTARPRQVICWPCRRVAHLALGIHMH